VNITINEKIRVNMGWQCPECSGVRVASPVQYKYECGECGCNWDGSRYPLPSLNKESRK
jgi:DNA-directed RNA polymerase subunit RPC12/RpoP